MTVTVLLFASLAQEAGARRVDIEWAEGATVGGIRDRLVALHPGLARFVETLVYAVNEDYADEDTAVPAGATVALIPPVSGGQEC
jgi:molybdopterin converting factor subunit 1